MMLRNLLSLILLSLALAAPAQAKRADLGIGFDEHVTFVAPAEGLQGPAPALCKRTRQYHVFGKVNVWASTDYVMSANGCKGNEFFSATPASLKNVQSQGGIQTVISLQERLIQAWGPVILLLTLIIIAMRSLIRNKLREQDITANFPKAQRKLIIAMASAAYADGELNISELETIHEMINRLSYRDYSQDEVLGLILAIEPVNTDGQIRQLGKGLIDSQKLAILKAVHAVYGGDRSKCLAEDGFLLRLANGLKLPSPQIQAVLSR